MKMLCKAGGCERPSWAKGYCSNHYYTAQRHDLLPRPRCSVDGCELPMFRKGMCNKHHLRTKRYGDPHVVKKLANGMATVERTRMLAAAARKRYYATPYGKLRRRFCDAKRRLHKGAVSSGGNLRSELSALWAGQTCGLCGGVLGSDKTFDHIRPLGRGGDNTIENLQLAHMKCNLTKNRYTSLSA